MPKPDGFALSEKDIKFLQRLLYQYNHAQRYVNAFGRPPEDAFDHEEFHTTEFYIAKTPEGGIPALTVLSSIGEGDQPGSAVCQILRTNPSTSPESTERIIGVEEKVYNLSTEPIAGEEWIFITRDKYGKWYALISSGGNTSFPAEITAGYEVTSGYPWKRIQLQDGGTFTDHDPVQTGEDAYTPDENTSLQAGTRGWLFFNPDALLNAGTGTGTAEQRDTWIFIPVYRTRTTCEDGELIFQTSTDGGVTWTDDEVLGVDCGTGTGTGDGSEPITVGGCGWIAGLRPEDCLQLIVVETNGRCTPIDDLQELILCWNGAAWESGYCTPGTAGTGTADDYFHYINDGFALVHFSIDGFGVPHLQIGNEYIVWDKCGVSELDGKPVIDFSGGSIELCGTADVGTCTLNYFTIRLKCIECPKHWYCVLVSGECDGTGTGDVIEALELTVYEADELGELICAGPFDNEGDALICGGIPSCTDINPDNISTTLNYTITGNGSASCIDGTGNLIKVGTIPPQWETTVPVEGCGESDNFVLECSSIWRLTVAGMHDGCPPGASVDEQPIAATASPVSFTFEVPACWFMDATGFENETVTIVITEP